MIRKPSSTALKALFSGIFVASLFIASCNNDKKETKEATKTDSAAPAPAPVDSTNKGTDTGTGHPVTPVN